MSPAYRPKNASMESAKALLPPNVWGAYPTKFIKKDRERFVIKAAIKTAASIAHKTINALINKMNGAIYATHHQGYCLTKTLNTSIKQQ